MAQPNQGHAQPTGKPGRPRGRKTKLRIEEVITEEDRRRAEVLTRHLARLASERGNLVALRKRLFGGKKLSRRRAQGFLEQKGPRYFGVRWYERNGIPLLDHRSYNFDPDLGISPRDATVRMVIRFEWGGECLDIPDASGIQMAAIASGLKLSLPRRVEIKVAPGSVLDEIREVASNLASLYDWSESAATVFVLTGDPPPVFAIGVKTIGGIGDDHLHFAFDLRIEPWVSPQSVLRAFQYLQRDAYGRVVQPLRLRALVLFEFIEDYRERKLRKSWEEIARAKLDFPWTDAAQSWNEIHGEKLWPYTPSAMSRDFERTWYAIVWPPIKPLWARRVPKAGEEQ